MILYKVYRVCALLSIYNLLSNIKAQLPFFPSRSCAFLRYIVFYCKLGCDTSEPQVSCISRACSSLVRQPYYAPSRFILKISGLETILATKKGHWDGRSFYMNEYTFIFLFSQCARCAQKRDCWESVRFASERSRIRILQVHKKQNSVSADTEFFFYSGPGGIRTARHCRRQGNQQPGGLLISARVPASRNI